MKTTKSHFNLEFRAWDIKNKEYLQEPCSFLFFSFKESYHYDASYILSNPEEFVVQRRLYLKDNNDVELYEGDVLKHKNNSSCRYKIVWSEEDCAYIMESTNGGAAFLSQDYLLNFEIIGTVLQGNYVKI